MGTKGIFHAKEHRERSQPEQRKSLGFLEKKKDYIQRAKDYHQKQNTLNKLREKARLRNSDEFYFRMISTKTENGIHTESSVIPTLTPDQEKLAKTQDLAYVRQRIQRDQNRCSKILNLLTCAPDESTRKRIVYVDNELEISAPKHNTACLEGKQNNQLEPSKELIRELQARKERIEKLKQVEIQMQHKENTASKESKFVE